MSTARFADPDQIRAGFSRAMSQMYQHEVPLYGTLMGLVSEVNAQVMSRDSQVLNSLRQTGEIQRMGMQPVGYYDLTEAGVPVHSTAFRAVHEQALQVSPFRVFTSLLRLELIESDSLREFASQVLAKRRIFTPGALALIDKHETDGGLSEPDAAEFIQQALETFRWHNTATVSLDEYQKLNVQHRLIADVVAFRGPHINHLTPRTLDIDAVQSGMPGKGITPKAVVEGPPRRQCPILLRQTSFKALEEPITFIGQSGSHSARFGEIEQRGAALTPKGRELYDRLLNKARDALGEFPNEANALRYAELLENTFEAFPDSHAEMRRQGLAYFRYFPTESGIAEHASGSLEQLVDAGHVRFEPLVYEDFLPVSAAGIFQSNLGDNAQAHYATNSNQQDFEQALGRGTLNELDLYADTQRRSLEECARALELSSPAY
ncbi:2-oxoadipate dioxygenase/decarboxylase HglS [Pseudomonas syringae]|uniref:2-oxoadipate dioxygenase/decarboxylase HglS n=1 Tax=Pseudomonas syringae TaxID=317 RepID=UPI0007094FBC|nr:DUF1338 family protein [Pseudomonas syringae]KWS43353.1 hypothetical protein AL060_15400 [Pseudomonas syringae pv. rhaphiolepidis]